MSTHQPEESGTFFVLPPLRRLFAVFDDPVAGSEVAAELRDEGVADDVWTFFGGKGIESLDPHVGRHGVAVGIVRVWQRLMTSDCEYCGGLATALRQGAMVLAVRVGKDRVEELARRLGERGGRAFAYGEHWDFVPLHSAGHALGFVPHDGGHTGPSRQDAPAAGSPT